MASTIKYSGRFQIDGIDMPKPSSVQTEYEIVSDGERLPATLEMVANYKGCLISTIWTYKVLNKNDYLKIYNAYVKATIINKQMYHKLITMNSDTLDEIEYEMYTENKIKNTLYKVSNNDAIYKDVTFNFPCRYIYSAGGN